MSEKVAAANLVNKGEQGSALAKLLAFSIALAVVPISTYFISLWYIFNGNGIFAAISAVTSANLVLVLYIILSVLEDQGNQPRSEPAKTSIESRKSR
ncbi:hypothetical protein BS47DRAFT_1328708 [Hydnum rufescens UP504]|uniref:Vacuolar ATPase assembly integral membrane protein VMA21 homolog n=1 Tax=Hydnum rufescens UP504 TaxID=1448309 RepID=A0A9P6AZB5_9AGAM|nr:hypothetical protein BS47DRAFT_1328708 [Hydnum rufescens UP504]